MNHVVRRRLTTLVSATCIPGLLAAALPVVPASASAATPTNQGRLVPTTAVESRNVLGATRTPPADTTTLAAVTCPSGWFCFHEEADFGNPRGKLSSCGWQNLATYDWTNRIDAAYYNLSAGSASFYESNGTYLFQVSAGNRSLSDVGSKKDKADKVYRACP